MPNAPTNTILDSNAQHDRYKNDLDLLFSSLERDPRLPDKYRDAALKRMQDVRTIPLHFLGVQRALSTDPYTTPEGKQHKTREAARVANEKLSEIETSTVKKIEAQEAERRNAFLAPKKITDPAEALRHELRQRELRDKLAGLDRLQLEARLREGDDVATAWLSALEAAPPGFGIIKPEVLSAAKSAIAEKLDPEIGELAGLRNAYSYAIGIARQTVLAASGLDAVAATTDPTPATDTRQSYTLSGAEVKA